MYTTAFLTIALTVAAPAPKGKETPVKLEGDWIVQKYVSRGKEEPKRAGMHFTFADGKISVREEKGPAVSYTLNHKSNPANIDLSLDKEQAILGIWKLEDDTLTICFPKGGKADRPKAFESAEGTNLVVIILKREKK